MAGDASSQIWLTHALNDEEIPKALTLCFSMKRMLTSRKLAVLVSPKVSPSLREALHIAFDFFFYLEEERNTAGLKDGEFAKLYALTLKSFEKIVFLSPTMLGVKNSDEIFNECVESQHFIWPTGTSSSSSIFMVRPCLQTFKILMSEVYTRNGNNLEQYLKTWTKNQSGGEHASTCLGAQYSHFLTPQSEFLLAKETDISIIDLKDIPIDVNTEKFGLFAQLKI